MKTSHLERKHSKRRRTSKSRRLPVPVAAFPPCWPQANETKREMLALLVLLSSLLALCSASTLTDYDGATFYKATVGSRVRIACNGSHWSSQDDDSISLILWFKGDSDNGVGPDYSGAEQSTVPIYSVDARQKPLNRGARHFVADAYKGRAKFVTKSSPPYLDLYPLEADDQSEYRCRIDYRTKPRENFLIILFVIVPPRSVQIFDSNGKSLAPSIENNRKQQIYGPLSESMDLTLMCSSRGGRPAPALTWRYRNKVIDDSYLTLSDYVTLRHAHQLLNGNDEMGTGQHPSSNNNGTQPPNKQPPLGNSLLNLDNSLSSSSNSINGERQPPPPPDSSSIFNQANFLFREWRRWPEFELYPKLRTWASPNLTNQQQAQRSRPGPFQLGQAEPHQARQRGADYAPAGSESVESQQQHLLNMNVHESLVTSLNVLKLTNLGLALNLMSPPPDQEEPAEGTGRSAEAGSSLEARRHPLLECQASNLHYDLKTLIRLFVPPSLNSLKSRHQLNYSLHVAGPSLERPAVQPTTTMMTHMAPHERQLVGAITRAVELSVSSVPIISSAEFQDINQSQPLTTTANQATALRQIKQIEPSNATRFRQPATSALALDNQSLYLQNLANVLYQQLLWPHQLMAALSSLAAPMQSRDDRNGNGNNSDNSGQSLTRNQQIALNIYARPLEVRISDSRRPLSAGQLAEFICQSSGSNPPPKLTWFKNKQLLASKLYRQLNDHLNGTSYSKLSLQLEREDNNSILSCKAENEQLNKLNGNQLAALEDFKTLTIHYSPKLKLELGNKILSNSIRELTDIYFVCLIDSNPPVKEITWLFNEKPLNETDVYLAKKQISGELDKNSGLIISNNNSLVLQKVKLEQKGRYSCMAYNSEGIGESNRIELRVLHAPICSLPGATQNSGLVSSKPIALHGKGKFLCQMEADPPELEIVWYLNNSLSDKRILFREQISPTTRDYDNNRVAPTEAEPQSTDQKSVPLWSNKSLNSQLNYLVESSLDYGQLYCIAKNSIGEQKRACVYEIKAPDLNEQVPPQPECLAVNVSSSSVWIGCEQHESPRASRNYYKFSTEVYSLKRDSTSNDDDHSPAQEPSRFLEANLTSTNLNEPLFSINNLRPKTNYLIRVYSMDSFDGQMSSNPSIVKFSTNDHQYFSDQQLLPGENNLVTVKSPESFLAPTIEPIAEPHQSSSNLLLSALISTRSTNGQTLDSPATYNDLKSINYNQQQQQMRSKHMSPATLGTWFNSIWSSLFQPAQSSSLLNKFQNSTILRKMPPSSLINGQKQRNFQSNNQLMDISDALLITSACLLLLASLTVVLILYRYSSRACLASRNKSKKIRAAQPTNSRQTHSDGSAVSSSSSSSTASSVSPHQAADETSDCSEEMKNKRKSKKKSLIIDNSGNTSLPSNSSQLGSQGSGAQATATLLQTTLATNNYSLHQQRHSNTLDSRFLTKSKLDTSNRAFLREHQPGLYYNDQQQEQHYDYYTTSGIGMNKVDGFAMLKSPEEGHVIKSRSSLCFESLLMAESCKGNNRNMLDKEQEMIQFSGLAANHDRHLISDANSSSNRERQQQNWPAMAALGNGDITNKLAARLGKQQQFSDRKPLEHIKPSVSINDDNNNASISYNQPQQDYGDGAGGLACNLNGYDNETSQALNLHSHSQLAGQQQYQSTNNQLVSIVVAQPSTSINDIGHSLISDSSNSCNDSRSALVWPSQGAHQQQTHFIELLPAEAEYLNLNLVFESQPQQQEHNNLLNDATQFSQGKDNQILLPSNTTTAILCPSSLTSSNSYGTSSSLVKLDQLAISPLSLTLSNSESSSIINNDGTLKKSSNVAPTSILKNSHNKYTRQENFCQCDSKSSSNNGDHL